MLMLHLLPGFAVLLMALIALRWPPRHINTVYGFRTHRAMRNPETWREANRHHPRLLLVVGGVTILAGFFSYLLLHPQWGILVVVVLLLLLLMLSILLTNRHLKQKFPE